VAKRKIEVCVSNVDLGSGTVVARILAEFPDVKAKRWGCLGYCHRCVRNPFVLVDDTIFIEAANVDELYEKVRQELLDDHETPAAPSK